MVRSTIHPDARKEVLKRLLVLNHKIHEAEVEKGLWDKKGGKNKGNNKPGSDGKEGDELDEDLGGLFNQK